MGNHHGKREKSIVVYTSRLPEGHIKEIELCYDNGLYLAVSYEDGKESKPYGEQHAVGVDLGEIHSIAAFGKDGGSLIVTGRGKCVALGQENGGLKRGGVQIRLTYEENKKHTI